MKYQAFLIGAFLTPQLAHSWTYAYYLGGAGYWWSSNPRFYMNTSTPANLIPLGTPAMNEWKLSGSHRYPYPGGNTGRDCGDGDYWGDDDDGYNVVDYWNQCGGQHATCNGGTLAEMFPIDVYGVSSQLAEVDIVMCSNQTWAADYNSTSSAHYQGTLTHEFGHALGLGHTDRSSAQVEATMHQVQALTTPAHAHLRSALSWDDVDGMDAIYAGGCNQNDWVLQSTSGQNVTRSETWWERCGADLNVYISTPTGYENWLAPVAVLNSRLGGYIKPNTFLEWEEFEMDHSAILTVSIRGMDNLVREIHYARNAPNWTSTTPGWRNPINVNNVSPFAWNFNSWMACRGDLFNDYRNTYGVDPHLMESLSLRHFVNTQWSQSVNHGAKIRRVRVQRR